MSRLIQGSATPTHINIAYLQSVFDFSAESRLEAELGPKAYERKKDGIYLGCGFSSQEDALRWLLSFGDKVLVTSPPEMVKKIKSTIKKMKKRYKT